MNRGHDVFSTRVNELVSRGWDSEDAERYVELYHTSLGTTLSEPERLKQRRLERKYDAGENFVVIEYPK